jgi:hypothetical protein
MTIKLMEGQVRVNPERILLQDLGEEEDLRKVCSTVQSKFYVQVC